MKIFSLSVLLMLLMALVSGCSSGRVKIIQAPLENYQKLGRAEGKACGSLGIAGTAYYFIPIGLNGRYERAYNYALASVPGATALIDVTLKEDWFWWVIGTARCVTITGEAIK